MTAYRLAFNGEIEESLTNPLRDRIADILDRPDCEELTVLFASEGGSTDDGIALYNFIRALPRPIHMHAIGHIGSIAVPVFLAGHRRTCTPVSRFFFHAFDWTFEGGQSVDRIYEALLRLESDIKMARQIAARHTTLSAKRLDALFSKNAPPTILTPEEARKAGIVEDVLELNPDGAEQSGVALWTVEKTETEKD